MIFLNHRSLGASVFAKTRYWLIRDSFNESIGKPHRPYLIILPILTIFMPSCQQLIKKDLINQTLTLAYFNIYTKPLKTSIIEHGAIQAGLNIAYMMVIDCIEMVGYGIKLKM